MTNVLLVLSAIPLVALVALYMIQPRAKLIDVSWGRFAPQSPAGERPNQEVRLGWPRGTRAFYTQLATLACLLLAALSVLLSKYWEARRTAGKGVRVLALIDTSASMNTPGRWEAVRPALEEELARLGENGPVELELATFDVAVHRQAILPDARHAGAEIARALPAQPTELGTNIAALQSCAEMGRVLLVITDQPAPPWAQASASGPVVWRPVGKPAVNVAITALTAIGDALGGAVSEVTVEVTGFGLPAGPSQWQLGVTRPNGQADRPRALQFIAGEKGSAIAIVSLPMEKMEPGVYRVHLAGPREDACAWDDTSAFRISRSPRLELQVPERARWAQAEELRKRCEPGGPVGLRIVEVASWDDVARQRNEARGVPTLAVWKPQASQPGTLASFVSRDHDSLLREISLERFDGDATWPVLDARPPGFEWLEPVAQMKTASGVRDVAVFSAKPPLAVIPQPPNELPSPSRNPSVEDQAQVAQLILLVNAIRRLELSRPAAPLYTLVTPEHPKIMLPEAHLAMDAEESNTVREPGATVRNPGTSESKGVPLSIWPWLVAGLALLAAIERGIYVWRGRDWQ